MDILNWWLFMKQVTAFNPPANFWSREWLSILQLVVNGLCKSAIVIFSYYWIKKLSENIRLDQGIDISDVLYLCSVVILIMLLSMHERYIAESMSQQHINIIRSTLLKRLMRASVRQNEIFTVGNLSSRLAGDMSALKRWMSLGISRIITHSILLLVMVVLIMTVNTYLGILIGIAIFSLVIMAMLIGANLKSSITRVRKNRIKIHSMIVERISSIAMIRAMGNEIREVNRINKVAVDLKKNISIQGLKMGLLRGVGESSSLLLISLLLLMNYYFQYQISTDEMMATISIIMFLNTPIRELGRVQEYYQGARISIKKLMQLYRIPRIVRGKRNQLDIENKNDCIGEVKIKKIALKPIFENLNLNASRGSKVALVGENGSGKSTIIQMMLGLIKPDSGTIKVNGVNPRKVSSRDRRAFIGCAGNNFGLMKYSFNKNLNYRNVEVSEDEKERLLDLCQLTSFCQKYADEKNQDRGTGEKSFIW
ncbi:MAG TPA: ABC transporter ATP-binding protein [Aeromonadales bacterium]|nr:ABC transporter ATP-binding protein [Aeromonadales bacterium]